MSDKKPIKIELAHDILQKLKAHPAAMECWSQLSHSHQRDYHQWVEEAKSPEVRIQRADKMLQMLIAKQVLKH